MLEITVSREGRVHSFFYLPARRFKTPKKLIAFMYTLIQGNIHLFHMKLKSTVVLKIELFYKRNFLAVTQYIINKDPQHFIYKICPRSECLIKYKDK